MKAEEYARRIAALDRLYLEVRDIEHEARAMREARAAHSGLDDMTAMCALIERLCRGFCAILGEPEKLPDDRPIRREAI